MVLNDLTCDDLIEATLWLPSHLSLASIAELLVAGSCAFPMGVEPGEISKGRGILVALALSPLDGPTIPTFSL